LLRLKKRNKINLGDDGDEESMENVKAPLTREKVISESVVSGTHTIDIKTWGFAHNSSDTEYMAGKLAASGYNLTQNKDLEDLWLLSSCIVKNPF